MSQQRWENRETRVTEQISTFVGMTAEEHIAAAARLVIDTDGRSLTTSMALAQIHATMAVAKGGVQRG